MRIDDIIPGDDHANVSFSLLEDKKGVRTGYRYFLEYRKGGEKLTQNLVESIYYRSECNTLSLYPVHILSGCATKAGRARGATNVAPQVLRQMMLTRVNMGAEN